MLDLFLPSSSPNSRRKRRLTSSPTQCYIQQDMPPPLPAEQSRTPHTADRRALRMQQHLTGGHHSPLSFHPSISLLFFSFSLLSFSPPFDFGIKSSTYDLTYIHNGRKAPRVLLFSRNSIRNSRFYCGRLLYMFCVQHTRPQVVHHVGPFHDAAHSS